MNMFDNIADAQSSLENGITELERDTGDDADELKERISRALVDLSEARRVLREVICIA